MLEASNLECVRGDRRLFAGVGFQLKSSEMLYLQGRNGSGKTSMLRMLCGLTPPNAGEIRWRGEPIRKLGDEFRAELCYLGHYNAIKEELTPIENLVASARLAEESLDLDDALDALERVGLRGGGKNKHLHFTELVHAVKSARFLAVRSALFAKAM